MSKVEAGPAVVVWAAMSVCCGGQGPSSASQSQAHWSAPQSLLVRAACIDTVTSRNIPVVRFPNPGLAADASGNAFAAWSQCEDSRINNIWASRFTSRGGWSVPEPIGSRSNDEPPSIAATGSGGAVVAWAAAGAVWANSFEPGRGWSGAERIGAGGLPQTAADRQGGVLVVWQEVSESRFALWARKRVTGTGWLSPHVVEITATRAQEPFDLAVGSSGDAVVVWAQETPGSRRRVWANRWEVSRGWGPPELLQQADSRGGFGPQVEIDGQGNALAVWLERGGARSNVWSSRFVPGRGWGQAAPIETGPPDQTLDTNADEPQLAMSPQGDAIAAWPQGVRGGPAVWANRFSPSSGWDAAKQIGEPVTLRPLIALDDAGNAMLVWDQQNQDGMQGVVARRFVASRGWASGWDPAEPLVRAASSREQPSDLTVDGLGSFFVIWVELDSGSNQSIWTNRFTR